MAPVEVIDQTLRDGQQSYWGMRMRAGQIIPVAPLIDAAGYRCRRPDRLLDLRGDGPLPRGEPVEGPRRDPRRLPDRDPARRHPHQRDRRHERHPRLDRRALGPHPRQARDRQLLDLRLPARRREHDPGGEDRPRRRHRPLAAAELLPVPGPHRRLLRRRDRPDDRRPGRPHDHPRRRGRGARAGAGAQVDPPEPGTRGRRRRAAGDALPQPHRDGQPQPHHRGRGGGADRPLGDLDPRQRGLDAARPR